MEILRKHYLAMVPIKLINWKDIIGEWKNFTKEMQKDVLLKTFLSDTSLDCPPSTAYQRTFLKHIITNCEENAVDLLDELYESYTLLVSQNYDAEEENCYKTYILNRHCMMVSLAESKSLISKGTTGLQTWQAAKFLAEWVMQNVDNFKDKNILELGSGLGLLGLVTYLTCRPQSYTFSDCHPSVLQLLAHNISNNVNRTPPETMNSLESQMEKFKSVSKHGMIDLPESKDFIQLDSKTWENLKERLPHWRNVQDPRITLVQLDWESTSAHELQSAFHNVDYIFATDVVFDTRIIPALVKVLKSLVRLRHQPVAYVASTIRNSATMDAFLQALDEAALKHTAIETTASISAFFYEERAPVELLVISC